ncbi:E3 ubiquitin-protein ligase Mdm2-like, partial [Oncorhynchus clarkii lewisi]|uniref:E3 ubiquitin-protein ligase Mdm2-like n=1 Tax=Oncorhynchus clarkii lewisi TaxID=490388 RepID=UPI0039B99FB9
MDFANDTGEDANDTGEDANDTGEDANDTGEDANDTGEDANDTGEDQNLLLLQGQIQVMFYLGQYIMKKQLYDMKQQHIVHCADDPLGAVLGVDSFSVNEPRVLFAMITQNLLAVKNQESQSVFTEPRSQSEPDRGPKEVGSLVSDACDDVLSQDLGSDSNFSVEFEVESIDSDAYSDPEEASVSGEDEVYEVTIFEAEEEDSFDDDTEITEA